MKKFLFLGLFSLFWACSPEEDLQPTNLQDPLIGLWAHSSSRDEGAMQIYEDGTWLNEDRNEGTWLNISTDPDFDATDQIYEWFNPATQVLVELTAEYNEDFSNVNFINGENILYLYRLEEYEFFTSLEALNQ